MGCGSSCCSPRKMGGREGLFGAPTIGGCSRRSTMLTACCVPPMRRRHESAPWHGLGRELEAVVSDTNLARSDHAGVNRTIGEMSPYRRCPVAGPSLSRRQSTSDVRRISWTGCDHLPHEGIDLYPRRRHRAGHGFAGRPSPKRPVAPRRRWSSPAVVARSAVARAPVPGPHGATPTRAAGALLPDARLTPGCRGRSAGHAVGARQGRALSVNTRR